MVFSSLIFLFYFLPLALLLYYLSPRRLRNGMLFLCSLVFYAWGEPVYVCLMLFSTLVDYLHGLLVERYRGTAGTKIALVSSVIINLTLLGVFKYADFAVVNLNALTGWSLRPPGLPLPIGISFYTFQTMSYTIDLYRGDAPMQRNIISFGAYVALFPQLIAGPIVRYGDVAEQLDHRRESWDQFARGARRFVCGLGKKVLLANNIGAVWDLFSALEPGRMSVLGAWLGIAAFFFQIYFDFSGYSDMAIGLGGMFGFSFPENFRHPYVSRSVTEFWRRWHISLGSWFREYVYIPLGGNRAGLVKQLRNIAVVWLLTGVWHGASWNFVAWGLYYCVLLILEKLFLLRLLERLPGAAARAYTLLFVLVGWVIFAFDSLGDGLRFLGRMLGLGVPLWNDLALFQLLSHLPLLVILAVGCTPLPARLAQRGLRGRGGLPAQGMGMALILLLSVAYLVGSSYNPFLYFRF